LFIFIRKQLSRAVEQTDYTVFATLYREAYMQCFKQPLKEPISETESKLFQNQILEQTGLTVGWRSLKNYSFYVFNNNSKPENPSIATLDTLARYVLKAPYTNEIARKNDEGHHPYWYLFRSRNLQQPAPQPLATKRYFLLFSSVGILLTVLLFFGWLHFRSPVSFVDHFDQLNEQAMQNNGWQLVNRDKAYWEKRNSRPKTLTLFTLAGDNWPESGSRPGIKNLLLRNLPNGCFRVELQLEDFLPAAEWQQAGLLLLTDTSLNSASIRISLAYNDFFGGHQQPKEIIVQAIASPGNDAPPEEFIHYKTLAPDSAARNPVLLGNLKHTTLCIEKQGNHYRFLFAGGLTVDAPLKELAAKDLNIEPQYVAIFAIKGRVAQTPVVPVVIRKFSLQANRCN
jgi:hypothetical protein